MNTYLVQYKVVENEVVVANGVSIIKATSEDEILAKLSNDRQFSKNARILIDSCKKT